MGLMVTTMVSHMPNAPTDCRCMIVVWDDLIQLFILKRLTRFLKRLEHDVVSIKHIDDGRAALNGRQLPCCIKFWAIFFFKLDRKRFFLDSVIPQKPNASTAGQCYCMLGQALYRKALLLTPFPKAPEVARNSPPPSKRACSRAAPSLFVYVNDNAKQSLPLVSVPSIVTKSYFPA